MVASTSSVSLGFTAMNTISDWCATRSAGPRFFHFVMGGGTPAALAADWLASALDQIAFNWLSSPLAMRLEQVSVGWLKELFRLPAEWSGVLPLESFAVMSANIVSWIPPEVSLGLRNSDCPQRSASALFEIHP